MKPQSSQTADTKQRVLEAATRRFAEKGFHSTTVAEICRGAGANIAAVNYHFGSKEALYREAWLHAHRGMVKAFPPDGGVPAEAPPEERLRGRIRAVLQRVLSEDGLEFRILNHEMAVPTGLLGQVVHDTIGPLRNAMEDVVLELMGGRADEGDVRLCVLCIIGPCMQMMRRQDMHRAMRRGDPRRTDPLESTVAHLTSFALAGIREIRRRSAGRAADR